MKPRVKNWRECKGVNKQTGRIKRGYRARRGQCPIPVATTRTVPSIDLLPAASFIPGLGNTRRSRTSSGPLHGWQEDSRARGWRFSTEDGGVTFDTAAVDPSFYNDPRWRRRWETDLRHEIQRFKSGKKNKLQLVRDGHYRLPGTI